jgi:SAM-dependent methyltransferase
VTGNDVAATQAFFAARASGWEHRFPDDEPRYAAAVTSLGLRRGDTVLDAGCGTARATPFMRAAVGEQGCVIAVDATPEMITEAARLGRARVASLAVADAGRLPLRDGCVDAVLAAGLVPHVADPIGTLRELHRVCAPGARLAVFHPIGRVALSARRGNDPAESILVPSRLRTVLEPSGWLLRSVVDEAERYLAIATRAPIAR